MATIKSYTDIEQSRKLAEILPLESADMREEWRDIEGYEGLYMVSNFGRVISLQGRNPRVMKLGMTHKGLDGIIVAKYTSMLEAANANGVTRTAISAAIHGYCKTCKNSIFEYE